jgi:hypothetical protein
MANVKFALDKQDYDDLLAKMQMIPGKAEKVINAVLHEEGVETLTQDITRFIPVSRQTRSRHAKSSDWSKSETFNLGFLVVSKGGAAYNKKNKHKDSFGYLIFPDEGRGVKNNYAHDFTGKGMAMAKPKIMDVLNNNIIKAIEEVL